jgi:RND family efflux transporter MFP subunit
VVLALLGGPGALSIAWAQAAAQSSPTARPVPAPAAPQATPAVLRSAQAAPGATMPAPVPELRAQLSPRRYTTLAAEIGARIQRLTVTDGSPVRAGQPLVAFDCSLQQAQQARAQASLGAAEKQLEVQQRLVELNATGRQESEQAQAEVAKTRAELAQMQAQLGKCQIHAPFGGRIAELKVREQQFVQPGQAMIELIDDSVLEVEFIMPSRWLHSVRTGSALRIAVDETGKTYPAKVLRLGARVDPVSQSIKVVAAIDGRHSDLIAGMSGKVLVDVQQP